MNKEKQVKIQIKFMCDICDITYNDDFINYVYNKKLDGFSGEILKKLKNEYENGVINNG